ncbi:hypothetical protein [Parafilimonas sp.]|uniref:hypothetical protein n=1 Tax=Parafilimonas sp. TaxID=1969739 RepID=UPI0039E2F2DB
MKRKDLLKKGVTATLHFTSIAPIIKSCSKEGTGAISANGPIAPTPVFSCGCTRRARHLQLHIFGAGGESLLSARVAFSPDVCNTVYTAAATYYTRGVQRTNTACGNFFSTSLAMAEGGVPAHSITVSA